MFHEQHISSSLAFESDVFVTLYNDILKSEANTSRSGQGKLYNYYIDALYVRVNGLMDEWEGRWTGTDVHWRNPVCVHSPTFLS